MKEWLLAEGEAFAHALCLQVDNGLGQKNEPSQQKKEKQTIDSQRMATFFLRKMICVQPLVCEHPDGFGLAYEPYPCKQGGWREVTSIPAKRKKNRPSIDGLLSLAGMDGFEPSKCQSQSLVPYRLATSQYCFSILSYFILVVKHFIKKFVFYKKMRKHQLKYDTKTCFLFSNNL